MYDQMEIFRKRAEQEERFANQPDLRDLMKRYTRLVIRFNTKIYPESEDGLKEYGLVSTANALAVDGVIDRDPVDAMCAFMDQAIVVPDCDFNYDYECWFTEQGFNKCAPFLYEVIMELFKKGFSPVIYTTFDFPPDAIVYADATQLVIDRSKLK